MTVRGKGKIYSLGLGFSSFIFGKRRRGKKTPKKQKAKKKTPTKKKPEELAVFFYLFFPPSIYSFDFFTKNWGYAVYSASKTYQTHLQIWNKLYYWRNAGNLGD